MKLVEKLAAKVKDNWGQPAACIAFLGDSVTQGCFEIYTDANHEIVPVFDQRAAYESDLSRILSILYPNVPVTMINAGISGSNAVHGFERLRRDVLPYHPDLTVVCFGLNDSAGGMEGIETYISALRKILVTLQENQIDAIFMTPNMMATDVNCHMQPGVIRDAAEVCVHVQNSGILDAYMDAARALCRELGVRVCDCYRIWKRLQHAGVDTNRLLSNQINHPTREMNWLFAYELAKEIISA